MKYLKMLGLAAVAAMAFMAFAASSASATTLEVGGVTKNESITITASLKAGTSALLRDTFGFSQNTCTESHVHGSTEAPYTAAGEITGALTPGEAGLSFGKCNPEGVKVVESGTLHIGATLETKGTVTSSGAVVEVPSPFGTLICETGEGTHIGTLTGVKEGHATMDINATIDCGISAKWTGTYTITSPTGLGVSA